MAGMSYAMELCLRITPWFSKKNNEIFWFCHDVPLVRIICKATNNFPISGVGMIETRNLMTLVLGLNTFVGNHCHLAK
jgi:hypothetical protein